MNSKLCMQYLNTLLIAVLGSLSKIKAYLTCKCNPDFWLPKFLCSVFFNILLKPATNKKNTKNDSPKTAHILRFFPKHHI